MKLTFRRQTIRPRYVFATSQGGVTEKQTIVVEVAHAGVVGLGEVAPSTLYGQTLESSEAALARMAALLGDDPFQLEPIIGRCIAACDGQRAAIAAVDSALHDWVGRRLGVSVHRLLGLPPPRVQTTFTIGVAGEEETQRKVAEAIEAGYAALKVKIGVESDLRTLRAIRRSFNGPLLLDANAAWKPAEAAEKIRALAEFRPTMIEQPLGVADWRHMAGLRDLGVAPIFADESCERPADVVRLHGFVDGINVKFTKCGGIREALRMFMLARGLGMQLMIGCFVSSSLAIAPALAIAGACDFADLDGALLLADDPFAGIACARGGVLTTAERPGLGLHEKNAECRTQNADNTGRADSAF